MLLCLGPERTSFLSCSGTESIPYILQIIFSHFFSLSFKIRTYQLFFLNLSSLSLFLPTSFSLCLSLCLSLTLSFYLFFCFFLSHTRTLSVCFSLPLSLSLLPLIMFLPYLFVSLPFSSGQQMSNFKR